jgi:hypothetical protein
VQRKPREKVKLFACLSGKWRRNENECPERAESGNEIFTVPNKIIRMEIQMSEANMSGNNLPPCVSPGVEKVRLFEGLQRIGPWM